MSLGIALGGFAKGFSRGMEMGQAIRDTRKKNREEDAISGITEAGAAEFEKGKTEGKYKDEDMDSFMADYTVPKMKLELMKQGKIDEAEKLDSWADSSAQKRGNRLYGRALTKLHMNDIQGAFSDISQAAKIKGYLPDGYAFHGFRERVDESSGEVLGYDLIWDSPDGRQETPVRKENLSQALATVFAPEVRFAAQMEQDAKTAESAAETKKELFTYQEKKKIDQLYPDVKDKDYEKIYQDADKNLAEQNAKYPEYDGRRYDKLTRPEQDAIIRQKLLGGQAYESDRNATTPAPATTETAPATAAPAEGVEKGGSLPAPEGNHGPAPDEETPEAAPPVSGVSEAPPGVDATTTGSIGIEPQGVALAAARPAPTQASPRDKALASADIAVKQGVNPVKVASQLVQFGIQPAQFPPSLNAALRQSPVQGIV
jgi:hypothetical protein